MPATKRRAIGQGARPGPCEVAPDEASAPRGSTLELPSELWAHVFDYIGKEDRIENVARVSRYWRALGLQSSVLAPKLWRPVTVPDGRGRYPHDPEV